MKKVKKLSLTDLVLYGLVFMVPIAPVSLYGVVYNLSHGMVALVYIIGAIAMFFTAYSYSTLSQHISSSGSAYAYAGVCINPAVGFLTGWILLLDYLLFPTLVAVLGGVAVHAILPQIPVWVWPLIYVAIGTGVNYLGIQQTAKFDKLLVFIQLGILAIFVLLIVRLMLLDSSQITLSFRPFFDSQWFTPGLIATAISVAALNFLGFDAISTLSEESEGGGRAVSKATLLALVLATVLFIIVVRLRRSPPVMSTASRKAMRRMKHFSPLPATLAVSGSKWHFPSLWRLCAPSATLLPRKRRCPECYFQWGATECCPPSSLTSIPRVKRRIMPFCLPAASPCCSATCFPARLSLSPRW